MNETYGASETTTSRVKERESSWDYHMKCALAVLTYLF